MIIISTYKNPSTHHLKEHIEGFFPLAKLTELLMSTESNTKNKSPIASE